MIEERGRMRDVKLATREAASAALRAGLVPSQVWSEWRRASSARVTSGRTDRHRPRTRARAVKRSPLKIRRRKYGVSEKHAAQGRLCGPRERPPWEARAVAARAALQVKLPWCPQHRDVRRRRRLASQNRRKMTSVRAERPALTERRGSACSQRLRRVRSKVIEVTRTRGPLGRTKDMKRRSPPLWRSALVFCMAAVLLTKPSTAVCCRREQTMAGSLALAVQRFLPGRGYAPSVDGHMSTPQQRRTWIELWDCWIRTGAG